VVMGSKVRDAYALVMTQMGTPAAERTCDNTRPTAPTAMYNTSQSADGRTVKLEWKNVNDSCSKVQSYTVTYSNFFMGANSVSVSPASCTKLMCSTSITVTKGSQVVWSVEATNQAGSTRGNSKTYKVP
jgi:hypothetical protein